MEESKRKGIITDLRMIGCVLPLESYSDEQLKEQYEHYKRWADSVGSFTRYTGLEEVGSLDHFPGGRKCPK